MRRNASESSHGLVERPAQRTVDAAADRVIRSATQRESHDERQRVETAEDRRYERGIGEGRIPGIVATQGEWSVLPVGFAAWAYQDWSEA